MMLLNQKPPIGSPRLSPEQAHRFAPASSGGNSTRNGDAQEISLDSLLLLGGEGDQDPVSGTEAPPDWVRSSPPRGRGDGRHSDDRRGEKGRKGSGKTSQVGKGSGPSNSPQREYRDQDYRSGGEHRIGGGVARDPKEKRRLEIRRQAAEARAAAAQSPEGSPKRRDDTRGRREKRGAYAAKASNGSAGLEGESWPTQLPVGAPPTGIPPPPPPPPVRAAGADVPSGSISNGSSTTFGAGGGVAGGHGQTASQSDRDFDRDENFTTNINLDFLDQVDTQIDKIQDPASAFPGFANVVGGSSPSRGLQSSQGVSQVSAEIFGRLQSTLQLEREALPTNLASLWGGPSSSATTTTTSGSNNDTTNSNSNSNSKNTASCTSNKIWGTEGGAAWGALGSSIVDDPWGSSIWGSDPTPSAEAALEEPVPRQAPRRKQEYGDRKRERKSSGYSARNSEDLWDMPSTASQANPSPQDSRPGELPEFFRDTAGAPAFMDFVLETDGGGAAAAGDDGGGAGDYDKRGGSKGCKEDSHKHSYNNSSSYGNSNYGSGKGNSYRSNNTHGKSNGNARSAGGATGDRERRHSGSSNQPRELPANVPPPPQPPRRKDDQNGSTRRSGPRVGGSNIVGGTSATIGTNSEAPTNLVSPPPPAPAPKRNARARPVVTGPAFSETAIQGSAAPAVETATSTPAPPKASSGLPATSVLGAGWQ